MDPHYTKRNFIRSRKLYINCKNELMKELNELIKENKELRINEN